MSATTVPSQIAANATAVYVRGILKGDGEQTFVIDGEGHTITLPRGASDAALTPHHVNRSKLFVHERLGGSQTIDADRIARAIEFTRFPVCASWHDGPEDREGRLVQAADLIGQLGHRVWLVTAR